MDIKNGTKYDKLQRPESIPCLDASDLHNFGGCLPIDTR